MDIASLVRAVIAAFEDATKLVQRIRDQRAKDESTVLPEEPTRDLLESLTLGPIIVRGHYQHDLKRFGEPYACGDIQARDQMKDVLISLQMSLVINLKTVYMDDLDVDFHALQTTSDDCRVNAGVCLGQMSQRLSDAAKSQAIYPTPSSISSGSGLVPPLSPSMGYSSTRSAHSSSAFASPHTPDDVTEHFDLLHMSPTSFHSPHNGSKTTETRRMSKHFVTSPHQHSRSHSTTPRIPEVQPSSPSLDAHTIVEMEDRSARRRSSQALALDDNILSLFPQPGGKTISPPPASTNDAHRDSIVSSGNDSQMRSSPTSSRTSPYQQDRGSRDRLGPEDYGEKIVRIDGRQFSNSTVYDMYLPKSPERQPSVSHSSKTQATGHTKLDRAHHLQKNSRPGQHEPRSDSLNPVRHANVPHRPSREPPSGKAMQEPPLQPNIPVPIPVELIRPPPPRTPPPLGPLPHVPQPKQHSHLINQFRPPSATPLDRAASVRTTASSATTSSSALPPIHTGPLILPTEKNLHGFCKGAFRLQAGLERKAFTVHNFPHDFFPVVTYWRCHKCDFEGPVHQLVNISDDKKKKGKPEVIFDPKVRVSDGGGVRYRWAFLAKCHVIVKSAASSGTPKGSNSGSFGCIFCCAEGKARGWVDSENSAGIVGGPLANSNGELKSSGGSSKSDGIAVQATPMFGNVAHFMLHVETVHRRPEGWPSKEMVRRLRVVVGRVAGHMEDEWDINFVPL